MNHHTASRPFYAAAAIGGAVLWLLVMAVTGRREAWDSGLYWVAASPLGLLLFGVLALPAIATARVGSWMAGR